MTTDHSKDVEAAYYRSIPMDALDQAVNKPFSADGRATLLAGFAVVVAQLPPPPAKVVDFGCGTGWTSAMLTRCGYDVTGVDISPEAIDAARSSFPLERLTYAVHDFDAELPSELGPFDAAVFYDALHHSEDETRPLRTAYLALSARGVCLACEPGSGHASSPESQHASALWGVLERDMTPQQVASAGRCVGFTSIEVMPHPSEVLRSLYLPLPRGSLRDRLLSTSAGRVVRLARVATIRRRNWGFVRLTK